MPATSGDRWLTLTLKPTRHSFRVNGNDMYTWCSLDAPTRHSFRVNGNDMYTWCSLDAILLPGLLETTGEIESTDLVTGDTIRLTITPDEVVGEV